MPAPNPIVLLGLASSLASGTLARPIPNSMTKRGLQLLEAHLRSFDPGEATALERLELALGEPLARQLRSAGVLGARVDAQGEPPSELTRVAEEPHVG